MSAETLSLTRPVPLPRPVPPPRVSTHIARLRPYQPGKTLGDVQRETGLTDIAKLASNENPLGPSPRAVAALRDTAEKVALYPDGAAPALREAVAAHLDVHPVTLVFGNGSDEILHLMALAFLGPGEKMVQGDPSFAMYEVYGTQMDADIVKVPLVNFTHDLEKMADAVTPETRLVLIANPNNPTGTVVTRADVELFLDRVPEQTIVVFDEAYHEFVHRADQPDTLSYIREGRNVVVLRTFSKAYGLAGLRVGYGVARPEITSILNRVRSPFNVSVPAQAAATAALGDVEHLRRTMTLNSEGRAYFYAAFQHMGLDFVPSEGNFVLVDVQKDSRAVFEDLQRLGVVVRAGAGLGLPTHIRVSTGTMPQNRRFLDALARVLASEK